MTEEKRIKANDLAHQIRRLEEHQDIQENAPIGSEAFVLLEFVDVNAYNAGKKAKIVAMKKEMEEL